MAFGSQKGHSFLKHAAVVALGLVAGPMMAAVGTPANVAGRTAPEPVNHDGPAVARELAVWDFDGTILDGDCTEGLVRDGKTVYAGLLADCIAAGFARDYRGAEGVTRFRRDYEAKIAAGRKLEAYLDGARIFAGANVAELEAFCRRRFRETIAQHLFAHSLRRFRELEASGVENHVVSASPDFFVQAAAEVLRVPRARVHGIPVKIRDGKLTDEIIEPFPFGDGKTAILRDLERTRGGKVRYGFGNSYSTDGPFLKAVAEQGGTATMFNGGKTVPGMTELFVCMNLTETVGAPQGSSPVPVSENSRPQPFADGDTFVFLGDSITHIANWTKLVMRRYLEVYPERTIRFRNAGVGGDSSWACTNRLDEDVFRHKPSVIVTMFGMNDAQGAKWAETFGPAEEHALTNCLANYRRHIALLADKLKAGAPGARLVWCTPSPYDDTAKIDTPNSPGKGSRFLAGVADIVRDFGRVRGEDVIDFNGPMRAFAATRQQDDPTFTLIGPDRTHPGAAGSFFMACQFLRQQGVDPNVTDPLVPWPETTLSRQLEKRIACEAVVRDVMLERWYLKWTIGTADDLTAVRAFADKIKSEGQKGFYEDRVPFYLKTWTPTFLADREAELQRLDADLQRAAAVSRLDLPGTTSFPLRGVYFATHFGNWYEKASDAEIAEYIAELKCWDCNYVSAWFDMHDFTGMDDPAAAPRLRLIKTIFGSCRKNGMASCLGSLANEAFKESPPALRADWRAGQNGYTHALVGHYHVEICPSKPGGLEQILKSRREVLAAFAGTPPDYFWSCPYDQGGCTCSNCAPWGANGYLRTAKSVAALVRQMFPRAKFSLSSWRFDAFGPKLGEWAGLCARQDEVRTWADMIVIDQNQLPLLEADPVQPYCPMVEISMDRMLPWGGFGANPRPKMLEGLIRRHPKMAGTMPYSEGLYEDLNKVIGLALLSGRATTARAAVEQYAARYFGAGTEDLVAEAVDILEDNLGHDAYVVQDGRRCDFYSLAQIDPVRPWTLECRVSRLNAARADRALALLDAAEKKMSASARKAWRWRILKVRAELDAALGKGATAEVLEPQFNELASVYRVGRDTAQCLVPPTRRYLRPGPEVLCNGDL